MTDTTTNDATGAAEAPPNARFTDLGGGTTAEMMSAHIQFFYDPTTQAARAIFNGSQYLNIGGTYHALTGIPDILDVEFTNQMTRRYASEEPVAVLDPVTNVDLKQVSVAGIMVLIKIAYDIEVNAREAQRLAAIAAAEAAAAEAAIQLMKTQAVPTPGPNGTIAGFTTRLSHLIVTFTDGSSAANGNTIASWHWDFGDGTGTSAVQNPIYTYAAPGTYDVTLIVTDSTGGMVKCIEQFAVLA